MIFNFNNFIFEMKRSKLNLFKDEAISNLYTSSIEIELETDDVEGVEEDYTEEYVEELIVKIRNSVVKQLTRISDFKMTTQIEEFIDNVLDEVRQDWWDYDYIERLLNENKYTKNNYNKLIIVMIREQVLPYFFNENFQYLESKFVEHLPNFYKKWSDKIKFEIDNTLDRGIEISNSGYFNSINELIEMIESFFTDFENQSYWKFTDRTGIHINIGPKGQAKFNILKGLLFLNDTKESPFVFRNMDWRKNSEFCGSLLSTIKSDTKLLEDCRKLKVSQIEDKLNSKLAENIENIGYKKFGVNIVPIKKFNYIEWRYPGGEIDKPLLIEKVLYFAFLTHSICNENYNRKDYLKKIYKFIF